MAISASEIERIHRLLGVEGQPQPREISEAPEQSRIGLPFGLQQKFVYAGLSQKKQKDFLIKLIVIGIAVSLGALLLQRPWVLALLPLLYFIEWTLLARQASKRSELFERDYTAFLLSLGSSIKTGMDPLVALCNSWRLFSEGALIRKELLALTENVERGLSEDRVVGKFAETIQHPDVNLFKLAFILARKEGSSLSDCLQRLAKVTRQRQSFRRKLTSAIAMQKLSATGIAVCAAIVMGVQFMTNPESMRDAMNHPVGSKVLMVALGFMFAGIIWMRRIGKQDNSEN